MRKTSKIKRWIFWTPRIASIALTLFLVLFSFDVFGQGYSFWQTIGAFLMHNIPVFILAIVIIIAWKYEIVGAIAFALAGLLYIYLTLGRNSFEWFMLAWIIQLSVPAFFIAFLYYLNWRAKHRHNL